MSRIIRRFPVIPIIQPLEWCTWVVDAARGVFVSQERSPTHGQVSHRSFIAPIAKARCAIGAQVQGREGAAGHGSRDRTIAMPMATVMCMPNVRPYPALQPPNVTSTK
jgi:hypothetical protein